MRHLLDNARAAPLAEGWDPDTVELVNVRASGASIRRNDPLVAARSSRMRSPYVLVPPLAALLAAACASQQPRTPAPARTAGSDDTVAMAAMHAEMSGMSGMAHGDMHASRDPHMYMTAPRVPAPGDSARAAALVVEMRHDLAKYRDVRVAEAAGFRAFLPNVPQPVYHYTNPTWAFEEAFRFDPAKPTSLLYRRNADGSFTLVGAMYTAPRMTSEATLNERIPLSVAQWHQHVNWCLPPRGESARWSEQRNGRPVFGPKSPVATESACDSVGGRFVPHLFGWMVHANVFASDDPRVIWGHAD
jgi:hypothetical protein